MTHTLRRSKSKYARTRRQHKKQRRIRGGGFLDDLVKKFKPSTDAEKCQAAKEAAQTACSNNVEGDIEMMPIASSSDSGEGLSPGSGEGLSSTASLDEGLSSTSGKGLSSTASLDEGFSSTSGEGFSSTSGKGLSRDVAVEAPVAAAAAGGAKKSKKNNKKRRQSRRKKLKSRKHKK